MKQPMCVSKLFFGVLLLLPLAGCTLPPVLGNGPKSSPTADWPSLRNRPFKLPTLHSSAPCPVTPITQPPKFGLARGSGPVYAVVGEDRPLATKTLNKILWLADPEYTGPILIRGRQLYGSSKLLFSWFDPHRPDLRVAGTAADSQGSPIDLYAELDLLVSAIPISDGWRAWSSYSYTTVPGCYGWQLDGVNFSKVIVTEVV